MSDNIRPLKVAEFKPEPSVIEHLERLLGMAKAGKVQSIAIVAECSDGVHEMHGGDERLLTLIGGLECLKARLVAESNS